MARPAPAWAPFIPYVTIGIGLLVFQNAWIAAVGHHLSMTAILLLAGEDFSLVMSGNNHKVIIISTILGAAGGLLLYVLWPYLGIPSDISENLQRIALTKTSWPYFVAYFILANAYLEELYWRRYLESDSRLPAINDFVFSGYHVLVLAGKTNAVWLFAIFLLLSLAAWFWRQSNRWNRGMTASVMSHLAADASVIGAIYYLTTR